MRDILSLRPFDDLLVCLLGVKVDILNVCLADGHCAETKLTQLERLAAELFVLAAL